MAKGNRKSSPSLVISIHTSSLFSYTFNFFICCFQTTFVHVSSKCGILDLGEFDLGFQRLYHPPVVIGQANFIRCPKHTPGNNIIYKWGKRSTITGANFLMNKPNYLVLDDGTLFYSHITENDVRTFNESKWTCAMEVKVNNRNSFAWANHVETELRIVGSKFDFC